MSKKGKKWTPTKDFWLDKDKVGRTREANTPPEDFPYDIVGFDTPFDRMIERERQLNKGHWLTDYLEEKRAQLGDEKFEKKRRKLQKEAEEAWEEHQRRIAERYLQDEERRRERVSKAAETRRKTAKLEAVTPELLENHLFESKAERERLLTFYESRKILLGDAFDKAFRRMLLRKLDKLEGRKPKGR